MPRLRAKDIRELAWDDLAAKQYWPFVGGYFVASLIYGAIMVLAIVALVIAIAALRLQGVPADEVFRPEYFLPIAVFSSIAAVPILYGWGFSTWSFTCMALAAANRELRFEHCLSGWGHGWKMCWTVLVVMTYVSLWSLLLIVPGILKSLSYAMTVYVQVEHPDWTANQCIDESCRLMEGNRWRLFCLGVSFIGWYLLLIVASLVPIAGNFSHYFLMPYTLTAISRFYFEIKREKDFGI